VKLINFNIDNDNIGLIYQEQYLDIHNCYEFRGFEFDTTNKILQLTWTRSVEEWSNEIRCGFQLIFKQVTYFKVRERDNELPNTDDTCLSFIGFLEQDMRDDFDSYKPNENIKDTDDLNINFQSEQAIKVNSAIAELKEIKEEIIYVRLIDEGTIAWRPMWAERLEEFIYKIKPNENIDRTDENLEFDTGQIVICKKQKLSSGQYLVATELKK
jgi:hypothetical protein